MGRLRVRNVILGLLDSALFKGILMSYLSYFEYLVPYFLALLAFPLIYLITVTLGITGLI